MYFKAVYTHIYLSVHNYAHFYTPIIHIFTTHLYMYIYKGWCRSQCGFFCFCEKKRKLAVRNNLTFNGDSIEGRLPVQSSILPRQRITYEKSLGCAYFITTASLYSCWSLVKIVFFWHFSFVTLCFMECCQYCIRV